MSGKQKISANGTYVFDPEDIEQLDELSFTSMIKAIEPGQQPSEAVQAQPEPVAGDTTINAMLEEPAESCDEDYRATDELQGDPEETGDLLAPELIFGELPPRRR
jgi:hypothetical protein